jgi:hypothetical protein
MAGFTVNAKGQVDSNPDLTELLEVARAAYYDAYEVARAACTRRRWKAGR